MAFNWLNNFHQEMEKPDNYAEKTLAQYRMGMKAKGSIVGVRIELGADACAVCRATIDPTAVYHPDEAPHIPLANCLNPKQCGCVYRPVMNYEKADR